MTVFTNQQVDNLNRWQKHGPLHPFTCGGEDHDPARPRELVATIDGWYCLGCDYTQDWAHEFMLDGSLLGDKSA